MKVEPDKVLAPTLVAAWFQSCKLLLRDGDRFNLVVHIADPTYLDEADLARFDPRRINSSAKSVYDVANTIFPDRTSRWGNPLHEFCAHYAQAYERMLRRGHRSWGTYFQRLIAFGPHKHNQIERILNGLGTWGHNHHAAFVAHLSSSDLDKPKPQGGPCLQYVQFIRAGDERLSMAAVYRSHDYFHKALGNFAGLARLLRFASERTGLAVGSLTCLSTYAYLGANRTRTAKLLGLR